ncbi:MAG: capsid protein [Wigfec virus K19_327]|nr:MAG: capsid protein [Wigfec virus K19_327]
MPLMRRKRFYRRKRYSRRPTRIGGFLTPTARSRFNPTKWIDSGNATGPCTIGGYGLTAVWPLYVPLNICTQGSAMTQRIGTKVIMKSLSIRGKVTHGNAQGDYLFMRALLVYDRQANNSATPATLSEILDASSTIGRLNLSNTARFLIVKDWQWVHGNSNTASNASYKYFNKYVKLPNLSTLYNSGNAGTLADIASGSLVFYIFSDVASNGNTPPTNTDCPYFSGFFRLRFLD